MTINRFFTTVSMIAALAAFSTTNMSAADPTLTSKQIVRVQNTPAGPANFCFVPDGIDLNASEVSFAEDQGISWDDWSVSRGCVMFVNFLVDDSAAPGDHSIVITYESSEYTFEKAVRVISEGLATDIRSLAPPPAEKYGTLSLRLNTLSTLVRAYPEIVEIKDKSGKVVKKITKGEQMYDEIVSGKLRGKTDDETKKLLSDTIIKAQQVIETRHDNAFADVIAKSTMSEVQKVRQELAETKAELTSALDAARAELAAFKTDTAGNFRAVRADADNMLANQGKLAVLVAETNATEFKDKGMLRTRTYVANPEVARKAVEFARAAGSNDPVLDRVALRTAPPAPKAPKAKNAKNAPPTTRPANAFGEQK